MNPELQQVRLVIEGHCSVIRVLQNWQCVRLRVNHFSVSVHWSRTAGNKQKQSGNESLVGKHRRETGHLAQAQTAWTLPAGSWLGFAIFICAGAGSIERGLRTEVFRPLVSSWSSRRMSGYSGHQGASLDCSLKLVGLDKPGVLLVKHCSQLLAVCLIGLQKMFQMVYLFRKTFFFEMERNTKIEKCNEPYIPIIRLQNYPLIADLNFICSPHPLFGLF